MNPARNFFVLLPIICLVSTPCEAEKKSEEKFFSESIKPLLESRCLGCHNQTDRKGEFSLQSAAELNDSGYLEPGKPDASHLLTVLQSQDGKRPTMPKGKPPLSVKEVEAIREWIKNGAIWPKEISLTQPHLNNFEWWSLKPVEKPTIPDVSQSQFAGWVRSPVDAFILRKLEDKKLTPSSIADRRTLMRRIYFDLIGLPPTPEEINAFVSNPDPLSYEKLVEQLLASPAYGERWARHWLDVVKYADTCGYDKDKPRMNAWPYRDYVIRSFNSDKPYSQFLKEQIAGDALYPNTPDGILGLGFLAAGPWDFIGHVEVSESKLDGKVARNLDRDEMVANVFNTFASLTVQCARCHDHKFDPITQTDYYRLQSVFAAVDRAERIYSIPENARKQQREWETKLAGLKQAEQKLETDLKKAGGPLLLKLNQEIAALQIQVKPSRKHPAFGYHSGIEKRQAVSKWVQLDLGSTQTVHEVVLHPCHDDYAGIGAGFGFPVRYRVESSTDPKFTENLTTIFDQTAADVRNPGLTPVQISVDSLSARYLRITATKLAPRQNDFIFALAEVEVKNENGKNLAALASVTAKDSIEAPVRWTKKNLTDGIWAKAGNPELAGELRAKETERETLLKTIRTPAILAEQQRLQTEIKNATAKLAALPKGDVVYAAATDFKPQGNFRPTAGKPRPIFRLHRGDIREPREAMKPGTLRITGEHSGVLPVSDTATESEQRAALANVLADETHPTTWRSIVNRLWHYHFGRGLVGSPNDFGKMGQQPTHPELLDWLAAEFRDNGQSMKHLHRLIVTSAVYQQSSAHHAENAAIDVSNQFLWRMNRRRLEAEELRDAMLSVSGSLRQSMYGPGYFLFEIEKPQHSPHYEYHKHDPHDLKSHRRAVYRFIVRSQPDPLMTVFDCADSSQSTPRRNETVTPMQALSLLNNKFTLVMAEKFAARLQAETSNQNQQITRAFQLITGRQPTAEEAKQINGYATRFGLPNTCRLLFNLNEFTFLD